MEGPSRRDPFTLRFRDDALEAQFRTRHGERALHFFRLSALSGTLLWAFVGLLVHFLGIKHEASVRALALFVGAPISCYGLLVPRSLLARRWHVIGVFNNVTSGFVALVVVYRANLESSITGVMLILVLYAFTFIRLRFVPALLASSSYLAATAVALIAFDSRPPALRIFDGVGLFAAASLVAYVAHRLERSERDVFSQELVIAAQQRVLAREKDKSDRLLLNVLPASIANRLKASDHAPLADTFEDASVLFADIVGFTQLSLHLSAGELVALLNSLFSRFDELVESHGLEKIKTIGDAYMVVGGVPEPHADHTAAMATLGLEMIAAVAEVATARSLSLGIRVGLHAGPVVAGVIGKRRFIYDLWGDTVNIASRMESHGLPGAVQVTAQTYERLSTRFVGEDRGAIDVKGKGLVHTVLLR